jgi:hypothetical protein
MIFGWIQRPIGGQVSDRDARDRRRHHHSAEPETPNPDFDFGTPPSTTELARAGRVDRAVSTYVMLVLLLVFVLPFGVLLIGFAISLLLALR